MQEEEAGQGNVGNRQNDDESESVRVWGTAIIPLSLEMDLTIIPCYMSENQVCLSIALSGLPF